MTGSSDPGTGDLRAVIAEMRAHRTEQQRINYEFREYIAVQTEVQRGMVAEQEKVREALFGNGKPGVIDDVRDHKRIFRLVAWAFGGGGLLTLGGTIYVMVQILNGLASLEATLSRSPQ